MGDFKSLATRKAFQPPEEKKWNLCTVPECECRGTHSDVPGSRSMMCGFHYHIAKGHEELAEWKKRDAMARVQEQRRLVGGPRYLKFGKDGV